METRFAGAYLIRPRSWARVLRFAGLATVAALSPSTYSAQAREVAVRQIYFTAWQVLAGYAVAASVLSLLLIEVVASSARTYGIASYSLELVLSVIVLEVVPLTTALFVALRSGAAIGAEIALAVVQGELEDRGMGETNALHSQLVPRIAGAALSVASLTTLGCLIGLVLAYLAFYGFAFAGLAEFTRIVAAVFDGPALAGFLLKCLLFGLAVAIIPAATALEAERGVLRSLPGVVLGGLVKLFFSILVIETASLVVKYA